MVVVKKSIYNLLATACKLVLLSMSLSMLWDFGMSRLVLTVILMLKYYGIISKKSLIMLSKDSSRYRPDTSNENSEIQKKRDIKPKKYF